MQSMGLLGIILGLFGHNSLLFGLQIAFALNGGELFQPWNRTIYDVRSPAFLTLKNDLEIQQNLKPLLTSSLLYPNLFHVPHCFWKYHKFLGHFHLFMRISQLSKVRLSKQIVGLPHGLDDQGSTVYVSKRSLNFNIRFLFSFNVRQPDNRWVCLIGSRNLLTYPRCTDLDYFISWSGH